ncbi:VTT domain-containing protein, partial [Cohaesibacter sp. CAU 1516]|uniref:VTT domain-containing protein n=1 Tax=Cohaesibacter sp. CAU 1516 TaxID=2576038 RepID=UPI0010FD437D
SQNMMMLTVFVTRMIPFLSFDAVSYAAGLTALSLTRFTIATLFGLIPMSFLLTHAGEQWVTSDGSTSLSWILIGGLAIMMPVLTYLWTQNSILKTPVSKEIQ